MEKKKLNFSLKFIDKWPQNVKAKEFEAFIL